MTTGNQILEIEFGYFFKLFKLLWIRCREFEQGLINQDNVNRIKALIIIRLKNEYMD